MKIENMKSFDQFSKESLRNKKKIVKQIVRGNTL